MPDTVTPWRIDIPQAELDDLRDRLNRARWPEEATAPGWAQGVPLPYLRELCAYWAHEYDWRKTERRLNELGQFRTEIDGIGLHFQHVRSPHPGAFPLVLTHGWPGSIIEFQKEVPLPSRRWAERRFTDIRFWHELDRGGHFGAFERPGDFVDDVRAFFRLVR